MKTLGPISMALAFTVLAAVGCSKSSPAPEVAQISGVKVDLIGFQRAFAAASQEAQQNVTEAVRGVRYKMYDKSLDALEKLTNDPNLTPDQKKVATSFMESVKQLAVNSMSAPPPPAPGQ